MITFINQHNNVQEAVADAFNPFDGISVLLSKNVNSLSDFKSREVCNSKAIVVIHFLFESEEADIAMMSYAKRIARKWLQAISGGRFILNRFLAISVFEEFRKEDNSGLRILAEVESVDGREFDIYDFAMRAILATDFIRSRYSLGSQAQVCFGEEGFYILGEEAAEYFKAYPIKHTVQASTSVPVLDEYAVSTAQSESLLIDALEMCAED